MAAVPPQLSAQLLENGALKRDLGHLSKTDQNLAKALLAGDSVGTLAAKLDGALHGTLGAKAEEVVKLVSDAAPELRAQLGKKYEAQTGVALDEALNAVGGQKETLVRSLLGLNATSPVDSATTVAQQIRNAITHDGIQGLLTSADADTLRKVLTGKKPEELKAIAAEYKKTYGTELRAELMAKLPRQTQVELVEQLFDQGPPKDTADDFQAPQGAADRRARGHWRLGRLHRGRVHRQAPLARIDAAVKKAEAVVGKGDAKAERAALDDIKTLMQGYRDSKDGMAKTFADWGMMIGTTALSVATGGLGAVVTLAATKMLLATSTAFGALSRPVIQTLINGAAVDAQELLKEAGLGAIDGASNAIPFEKLTAFFKSAGQGVVKKLASKIAPQVEKATGQKVAAPVVAAATPTPATTGATAAATPQPATTPQATPPAAPTPHGDAPAPTAPGDATDGTNTIQWADTTDINKQYDQVFGKDKVTGTPPALPYIPESEFKNHPKGKVPGKGWAHKLTGWLDKKEKLPNPDELKSGPLPKDPTLMADDQAKASMVAQPGDMILPGDEPWKRLQQDYIGDCYFVAGLASALKSQMKTNPKFLDDMIRLEKNGTWSVRFFRKDGAGQFKEEWVNVTTTAARNKETGAEIYMASSDPNERIWGSSRRPTPSSREARTRTSAMAVMRTRCSRPSPARRPETGRPINGRRPSSSTSSTASSVVASPSPRRRRIRCRGCSHHIDDDDAYSVVDTGKYSDGTPGILVRNPWGSDGKNGDGLFWLTQDEFKATFSRLYTTPGTL